MTINSSKGAIEIQKTDGHSFEEDVQWALVTAAYERQPLAMLLQVMTTMIGGLAFLNFFTHRVEIFIWLAALAVSSVIGIVCVLLFRRYATGVEQLGRWRGIFFVQCLLAGLAWGLGPMLLFGDALGLEIAVFVASLLCICGVSIGLLMPERAAMTAFLATMLLTPAAALLVTSNYLSYLVAMLLLASSVMMSVMGNSFHQTMRKLLETQFRLKQAANEAQAARTQAEYATAIKSQFLANMSHEIRTPMHAVLGMLSLLKNTDLSNRQIDYTQKIEGAAKSLLGLLNDILDFSKIEADKMELDLQPFRIDRMMQDLSVILSANAGSKPIEVLMEVDPHIPKVLNGDAMRLRQVLINIAGNAIKFTQNGEVVVSLKLLARDSSTCKLRFSVRDTGIGISPEDQAIIFAEFTQAESNATRRFGGSGLGLSISRRLVALMGGVLQVQSVLEQGSLFYFDLTMDAMGQLTAKQPQQTKKLTSLRVLVVDDNSSARELMCNMCHSWGWFVALADNGEHALEQLQVAKSSPENSFDLVLIDWELPSMDGWQTIAQIKELYTQEEKCPEFIMVTGNGRERLIERTEQEVVSLSGFLVKPFTASMLFDTVADARLGEVIVKHSGKGVPKAGRLEGIRLMVVEDNPLNRQVAQELLKNEGAEVELAVNGQHAVSQLAKATVPFDAVLMDLQMPTMDGFVATRMIRNQLKMYDLPIIAMTANAMQSDREASFAAGMNAHVGKPFNIDLLVRVIQKAKAGVGFD
jgi:signal transduction histidine kinase/CheY-like chemotaxis protein